MSGVIKAFFWGAIFLVLQVSLVPVISLYGLRPDFLLIFVMIIALQFGRFSGLGAGFVTGLVEDAISMKPIGLTALIKGNIGFLLGIVWERRWMPPKIGQWGVLIGVFSLMEHLLESLLFPQRGISANPLGVAGWGEALYTAIVGVLVVLFPLGSRLIVPKKQR
ncbi:MAG: rod shape-determining protein MreD [bacterium]